MLKNYIFLVKIIYYSIFSKIFVRFFILYEFMIMDTIYTYCRHIFLSIKMHLKDKLVSCC